MGQWSKGAAMKDVPTKSSTEASAKGMGQRSKYAAMKDAPSKLEREESVLGTEKNRQRRNVAMKDATIIPRKEECAGSMGRNSL